MDYDIEAEMARFFDFDDASNMPSMAETCGSSPTAAISGSPLPIPEIMENFGIMQEESTQLDFTNFAKWIPTFSKPKNACDYCKARRLDCWFTYENQTGCSACCALFRCCSFTYENPHPPVLMDTLHPVYENEVRSVGEPTGLKALRSWDRTPLDHPDEEERMSRRSTTRFSKESLVVLRKWMDANKHNPYPTDDEKEELQRLAGLTGPQVNNWLANTRRRNKAKGSRGASPSIRSPIYSTSPSIPISGRAVAGESWEVMNPMERWAVSPPENEPASVSDIANAVANSKVRGAGFIAHRSTRTNADSSESGSISQLRAPSIASLETPKSESQQSSGSFSSLASSRSRSSRNSFHSAESGARKDKRRRRKVISRLKNHQLPNEDRPYQCTFCTDSFRTKYDWMRHEKSLHLNLEKYICAPLGGIIASPTGMVCVFCGELNPSEEHLDGHNHVACRDKSVDSRTFYRKDHLRQHLRLVHGCKIIDSMNSWKVEVLHIVSRCGFCGSQFDNWIDRCDHLSRHFRSGSKMRDWKGCRGFDEEVSKHVTNSMPPFLIGIEASSLNPFSASNEPSMCHHLTPSSSEDQSLVQQLAVWNQSVDYTKSMVPVDGAMEALNEANSALAGMRLDSRPPARISTCWEVLTVRLGLYVEELQRNGFLVTDESLQNQARLILFDSEDNWNQTAADNEQWLELFKKAHGLPSKALDSSVDMREDLGVGELSFDTLLLDSSWDMGAAHLDPAMTGMDDFHPFNSGSAVGKGRSGS